jgi:hypothetical protein
MNTSSSDPSDDFKLMVLDNFKFLETEYNFSYRSSKPHKYTQIIVYENLELYVVLSYGPPAYEPEMSFGRRGIDNISGGFSFHAGDLLQLDCCRDWTWDKLLDKSTLSWIRELARLLKSCGNQCLSGNSSIYSKMKARRETLVAEWLRDEKLKGLRAQIELAWRSKEYEHVIHLYKSIDDLTEIDKRRIDFAISRAKN